MVINQIYNLINRVQKQATGKILLEVTNDETLVAFGNKYILNSSNELSLDVWMKTFVDVLADIEFMDRGLRVESLDIERNEREWGAVRARVYMKPVEARHNTEYDLNNTAAFNPFEIVTPETAEILFSNHSTFEYLVTLPKRQLFGSFQNAGQQLAFVDFITKQLNDGMTNAQAGWERMAVANFIGEKIQAQATQSNKMHAVNILPLFNATQAAGSTITADKIYSNPEFMRFFSTKMIEFKNALVKNYTDVFNSSDGFMSQVPESFLKVYVNQAIASKMGAYLYSNTYHDEFVKLDGYKEVEFWQALNSSDGVLTEATRTALNVILASDGETQVSKKNVLAVLFDKDAIASFYRREEAEMIPVYTKGTNYYRAVTAEYINDLYLNAIVIYAEDPVEVDANISAQKKTEINSIFGINVDETQSNFAVSGNTVSATLAYVAEATTFDMNKGHHFLVFHVGAPEGSTAKVLIDPTQGSGWVTLDSDNLIVAQVTENTKGMFIDIDGVISYFKYDLTLSAQ